MSDPRSVLEGESRRFVQTDGAFERLLRRRDRKRRNQRIEAGVLGLTIAIAGAWLGIDAIRSTPRVPANDPTPTPTPIWSPVREGVALAVHPGDTWDDPHDTDVGWVDVERVSFSSDNELAWYIQLADKLPLVADLEPGRILAHGLVLDSTGDGVADYVIGIDNDAPERGEFHVWVTDLATGETDEQIGPPYGVPFDFRHPGGVEDRAGLGTAMDLFFLPGSEPADLNPGTVRWYAWASATNGDEVIASDYAPDTGWMTRT